LGLSEDIYLYMDCKNTFRFIGGDVHVSFPIIVDDERFAGAGATGGIDVPADDVAVGARGQPS